MENISFGVAFMAGIFSFLSPCVLPLVPGYISFISGISFEDLTSPTGNRKTALKAGISAVFFVLGLSIVFIALGASATVLGQILLRHMEIFTRISGIIIIILGLHLSGVLKLRWLNFQKKIEVRKVSPGPAGAFLVGLAFAFGWTPCIGPILGGILTMAAAEKTVIRGIGLLSLYSLGLGIPFVATGFAVGFFMKFLEKYRKFIRWGEMAAGVFLVLVGVLIFFDRLGAAGYYISSITGWSTP